MHRFFCSSREVSGNKIEINDQGQLHHIRDVLRLKVGKEVVLVDEKSNEYLAEIESASSKSILFKIKDRHTHRAVKRCSLTIACAIPKKSRMDDIVDKLTQLGVDRIIPLKTERVLIKLDKHKEMFRHERWKKVALAASQQSQRNTLPIIEPVKNIREVLLERDDYDLKLMPTLMGERKSLKEILAKSNPKNILVLIGPEGDFSDAEVALAIKSGCIPVSLGESVLRVETAAVAVASFIRLYADN